MPVLEFGSCYVYSPTGAGPLCERSRLLRALLKEANPRFIELYALQVGQQIAGAAPLAGFLTVADLLVPVPGSVPRCDASRHGAARLAEALLRQGLGCATWNGLRRARPVRKSGTAPPRARPTVALHYDSFTIDTLPYSPATLVLIDDVITKGRTLLAAAARLHDALPGINIKAFALLRTMGLAPNVRRLLEPCKGTIRWRAGDACREP